MSNALEERRGSRRPKAQYEHAAMRAGYKATHVSEIEILRDEKAAIGLRRSPNTRIIESRKTFSRDRVDIVPERRER
jgi:hypothetical protein